MEPSQVVGWCLAVMMMILTLAMALGFAGLVITGLREVFKKT
jgi:hypothetical protein